MQYPASCFRKIFRVHDFKRRNHGKVTNQTSKHPPPAILQGRRTRPLPKKKHRATRFKRRVPFSCCEPKKTGVLPFRHPLDMLRTPRRGWQNLKMFHKITRHVFISTFSATFLRIIQMAKLKLSPSSVNVYLFERLSQPNYPPPTVAMSLKHLTLYPWVCLLGWVSQPYYVKRSIFRIWPSSRVYSRQSRVHSYVVHCRWLFKAPWILKLHAATRKKHMPNRKS